MMRRIVVPDDFLRALTGTKAGEKLKALGDITLYSNKAKNQEELVERLKNAEAIINIRAYSHFTRDVLASCPHLRLISIWGTGTDNVDLVGARELGVTVTNTPGASALSVAEHTIAILLSLTRQIPLLDREVRAGK